MTTTSRTFTMTIGGEAVSGDDTFGVHNPATGEVFAEAPNCSRAQLDIAMESAQRAFAEWQGDVEQRRQVMYQCAALIEESAEEIGRIQTLEQGMPLGSSVSGVTQIAASFRSIADLEIPRLVIQDDENALVEVARRPIGVIAAIKAWNGPIHQAVGTIAPAFRAGCTVVFKPSPYTPLATLALGEILRPAVPEGVLNVISGSDPLGQWMVEHPIPRGVSFTGSIATGKRVNVAAAADLKRVLLELGGNDAAIVLDDVDPEELAKRIFWTAFANAGQVCIAVKRIFVPEALHDDIVSALARIAREVKVGDGFEEGVQMGPLTNEQQFVRVRELVDAAIADGAVAVTGGHQVDRPGYFFEPTILTNVEEGSRIVDEEQFGPAVPILPYHDVAEAIERANATSYGLGGSVWSSDPERAQEVAEQLQSGMAWVNTHIVQNREAPFGGAKWSGIGSQNGLWSVYAYTDPQNDLPITKGTDHLPGGVTRAVTWA